MFSYYNVCFVQFLGSRFSDLKQLKKPPKTSVLYILQMEVENKGSGQIINPGFRAVLSLAVCH